jgi:hypothetical protein
MFFAEDIGNTGNATQPSDNALLGIGLAALTVITVVVIGFLFLLWLLRRKPSQTKSSQKVDKELNEDEDPAAD